MIPDNPSRNRYRYTLDEGYESRSQRRLQEDLGVDKSAAEVILHLRSQVIELQAQLRQLENELEIQHANRNMRLAKYRKTYYEATWIELELKE